MIHQVVPRYEVDGFQVALYVVLARLQRPITFSFKCVLDGLDFNLTLTGKAVPAKRQLRRRILMPSL